MRLKPPHAPIPRPTPRELARHYWECTSFPGSCFLCRQAERYPAAVAAMLRELLYNFPSSS